MKTDNFSGIRSILLSGEEFQRLERLSEILDFTVDEATRDFNLDVLHSDDYKKPDEFLTKFSEIIMTFPMIAERRVTVIRNFDKLHQETRKKTCEIILKIPETSLVIVEGEKASLSPAPKKYFKSENFKPVYENRLPLWVRKRLKKRGKKISDSGIALLINNVGTILGELDSGIEKIIIVAGNSEYVNEDNVKQVVGSFRRDTIWALCNAVGLEDFKEAANILKTFLEAGKDRDENKINETTILYRLNSHIMKISEYNRLIKKGIPKEEAMKVAVTGQYFWDLNKMEAQTGNFNPRRIRHVLTVLGNMESALKRSGIDKKLLMEFLIPFIAPKLKKA